MSIQSFRQDYQDDRVWCLEQMLRHEGCLDSRIYECADYCASNGIINDVKEVVSVWENWKTKFPRNEHSQINRL